MAGITHGDSPLHEQACVAGATMLGAAVGAYSRTLVGIIVGAAVGFTLGRYICSRDDISAAFKDKLDFISRMKEVSNDTGVQAKIVDKMVADHVAKNREAALVTLRYVLSEALKDPDKYFAIVQTPPRGPATSKAAHGLSILNRASAGATA